MPNGCYTGCQPPTVSSTTIPTVVHHIAPHLAYTGTNVWLLVALGVGLVVLGAAFLLNRDA